MDTEIKLVPLGRHPEFYALLVPTKPCPMVNEKRPLEPDEIWAANSDGEQLVYRVIGPSPSFPGYARVEVLFSNKWRGQDMGLGYDSYLAFHSVLVGRVGTPVEVETVRAAHAAMPTRRPSPPVRRKGVKEVSLDGVTYIPYDSMSDPDPFERYPHYRVREADGTFSVDEHPVS